MNRLLPQIGLALAFAFALTAAPPQARATARPARLVEPLALAPESSPVAASASSDGTSHLELAAAEFGAGVAAAAVSVPASLALATALGASSSSIYAAAIPAALLFLALPPLAVTSVEWYVGNHLSPGSARFRPALYVALGAHTLALVGGILLNVSTHNLVTAAWFTGAETLLLPLATTAALHVFRGQPQAPAAEPAPSPVAASLPTPWPLLQPQLHTRFLVPVVRLAF